MKTLNELQTKAFLDMVEAMKVLEQQLAQANERIRQLEAQLYNGSTK
jgi:hypothetical protein